MHSFTRRVVVFVAICSTSMCGADRRLPAADRVEDFSLPATSGQSVSLSRDPAVKFHVLCFLGTECPLARVYGPRLQRMSDQLADRGVEFIGIDSNVQDSMDDLKHYAQQHGIHFPVAKDYDCNVALQVGATRTPEVFVIDRSGAIRYQGRIDDQYQPGLSRSAASQHDLRDAIEQMLAGRDVTRKRTTAVGCLIALPSNAASTATDVTFCDQISRILGNHCTECHRAGEIGPFALEDYDEVVGWADMSLEVIDQGRMPPWHASRQYGSFANARHMPEEDKLLLRRWVDAGMPYGSADQLPPKPQYVRGWRLPKQPDAVYSMSDQPFQVPAEGTVEYQYFVVDPGFTEDKWVRAAQLIPGNAAVVHHSIAFTRPPDGSDFRDFGLLSAYVPGHRPGELPEGFAQRVPAGSRIVFQMHYTPIGRPQLDMSRLGLVFLDPREVTHEVIALAGLQQEFEIPPGAPRHQVVGRIGWFPKNGFLLSIIPHMHLRGKSFEFQTVSRGQATTLLKVPAYDFNWQHNYELTEPLPLDEVDQLTFSAVFDNSADNPANPDPTQFVTWGDQTWQEMAVTFISVAQPLGSDQVEPAGGVGDDGERLSSRPRSQLDGKAKAFADRYIDRFDSNGDQQLTPHELPHSVRIFSFRRFDHNGDGRLSHDEITAEAMVRLQR